MEPDGRHKVVSDRDTYTLTVLEPTVDGCGPFECVAINASGEARCQAEVGSPLVRRGGALGSVSFSHFDTSRMA